MTKGWYKLMATIREYHCEMLPAPEIKEYFYIGIAHTREEGHRILKIGTTKNLKARAQEHRRKNDYKNMNFALTDFEYIQSISLSKANTLLLENSVRAQLREMIHNDEVFVRNDRFIITHNDEIRLYIKIKSKEYTIIIPAV